MKKLFFALAFAGLVVYPTFEQAWQVCIDGHVAANYIYQNGQFVQNGWVCIPGSGGQ